MQDMKRKLALKIMPVNMPKYLKVLDHPTNFHYPEVVTTHQKDRCGDSVWMYRSGVSEEALDNLNAQRIVWASNTKVVMTALQDKLGSILAGKSKKTCMNMAVARGTDHGRKTTPDCFDIILS